MGLAAFVQDRTVFVLVRHCPARVSGHGTCRPPVSIHSLLTRGKRMQPSTLALAGPARRFGGRLCLADKRFDVRGTLDRLDGDILDLTV